MRPVFKTFGMTKADIVNEIVEKSGVERAVVLNTVETFMKVIKSNMGRGKNIYLRGFGTFLCKKRAAKIGRNITRNESVQIPAHFIPAFKPAKTFADRVKKSVKAEDKTA